MSLLERDSVLVSTTENGAPIVDLPFTRVNNVEGIGRSPNTTYSAGNVVYTDSNLSVALKCVTAGTTSNTELDISTVSVGQSVEDGTVVWQVVSRVSDGIPVGFKYFDFVTEIPVGAVGALGVLYNRELYADLWKAAQKNKQVITEAEWQALAEANDGNVPWYSDGDGNTTFRVPALKCWVKGASGIEEVGNYDTVQPPSLIGIWLIKAFGTVTNVGNVDVANVMSAVEQIQSEQRIKDVSISGRVITLTFADGTTKTLTTQDTSVIEYTTSRGVGYAKFSNGFILAWALGGATDSGIATVNKPISFTTIKAFPTDYSPNEGQEPESVCWYSNSGSTTYDRFKTQYNGGFNVLWIGMV